MTWDHNAHIEECRPYTPCWCPGFNLLHWGHGHLLCSWHHNHRISHEHVLWGYNQISYMVTVVKNKAQRITLPSLLERWAYPFQDISMLHRESPCCWGGELRLYDKSGHTHASREIPIKGPLGSKSGQRWGTGIKWPVVYKVFAH